MLTPKMHTEREFEMANSNTRLAAVQRTFLAIAQSLANENMRRNAKYYAE